MYQSLSSGGIFRVFFSSRQHPFEMSPVDDQDKVPHRFSDLIPTTQASRILFHASDLPVGPLVGPTDSDFSVGQDSLENLRRELFAPTEGEDDSSAGQSSHNINEVTLLGSMQSNEPLPEHHDDNSVHTPPLIVRGNPAAFVGYGTTIKSPRFSHSSRVRNATNNNHHTSEHPAIAERKPAAKRNRFSYSKKFFYAPSSFYLRREDHPSGKSPSTPVIHQQQEDDNDMLLGQVVACPTKFNNYSFEVKWLCLPSTLLAQDLQTLFPKASYQHKIHEFITNCPLNMTTDDHSHKKPNDQRIGGAVSPVLAAAQIQQSRPPSPLCSFFCPPHRWVGWQLLSH